MDSKAMSEHAVPPRRRSPSRKILRRPHPAAGSRTVFQAGVKLILTTVLLSFLVLVSPSVRANAGPNLKLGSSAVPDGERIPRRYVMPGAGGEDISLPLFWTGAPDGTKSFALSMVDTHPVAGNWVHWLVINIPPTVSSLPAGASGKAMPAGAAELQNSFGTVGYGGPQPPPGTGDHPYVVTLYALRVSKLSLGVDSTLTEFRRALQGKVLAEARFTGLYSR